jgi:hypothetical protein
MSVIYSENLPAFGESIPITPITAIADAGMEMTNKGRTN